MKSIMIHSDSTGIRSIISEVESLTGMRVFLISAPLFGRSSEKSVIKILNELEALTLGDYEGDGYKEKYLILLSGGARFSLNALWKLRIILKGIDARLFPVGPTSSLFSATLHISNIYGTAETIRNMENEILGIPLEDMVEDFAIRTSGMHLFPVMEEKSLTEDPLIEKVLMGNGIHFDEISLSVLMQSMAFNSYKESIMKSFNIKNVIEESKVGYSPLPVEALLFSGEYSDEVYHSLSKLKKNIQRYGSIAEEEYISIMGQSFSKSIINDSGEWV